MITPRNKLFRKLQGYVYHVTSTKGFRGILDTRQIVPNPDGRLAHSSVGSIPGCYVCQELNAVSLLDLRPDRLSKLFDRSSFQNWTGVFTYNEPCIALQLNVAAIESNFVPLSRDEILAIPGRFIVEAEICHRGAIPISAVQCAHLIRGLSWVEDHEDLEAAYVRSVVIQKAVQHAQSRRAMSGRFTLNILSVREDTGPKMS